jgi:hypothetical protein
MSHPYEVFEADPLWNVVSDAMQNLAKNGDVAEQTAREYIVGYIVKSMRESGQAPRPTTVRCET